MNTSISWKIGNKDRPAKTTDVDALKKYLLDAVDISVEFIRDSLLIDAEILFINLDNEEEIKHLFVVTGPEGVQYFDYLK